MENNLSVNISAQQTLASNSAGSAPANSPPDSTPTPSARVAETTRDVRTAPGGGQISYLSADSINVEARAAMLNRSNDAVSNLDTGIDTDIEDDLQIARMETQPAGPVLGVEVHGLDLSKPMGPKLIQKIDDLISQSLVVIVKGQQHITPKQQVAFTEYFGAVEPHPLGARKTYHDDTIPPSVLVVKNPMNVTHNRTIRNDYWHSDLSCMEKPVSLSVLRAIEIPGKGWGDTMFCNMYTAYESLSPGMKKLCHDLKAVHNTNHYFDPERSSESFEKTAENVHPVVRTHAKTGKYGLFLSHSFIDRFEGMTFQESRPLLKQLIEHSTQPHNVYRHRWDAGDVVIWDNRCTMHYAVFDYKPGEPRHLQRTTASGERPFMTPVEEAPATNSL